MVEKTWRPIAEAPKDGDWFVIDDGLPFVVRWTGDFFRTAEFMPVAFATRWRATGNPRWATWWVRLVRQALCRLWRPIKWRFEFWQMQCRFRA